MNQISYKKTNFKSAFLLSIALLFTVSINGAEAASFELDSLKNISDDSATSILSQIDNLGSNDLFVVWQGAPDVYFKKQ